METYVILHNIRSAHNVGSVFRTADGAGVTKIYLTGYTPTPIDRFGRKQKQLEKASLGAEQFVPYEVRASIEEVITELKEKGVEIVAVEQTEHSITYQTYARKGSVAFIFGNEILGIEKEVLALADVCVEIPMQGQKESLNVSVCAGITLFNIRM